MIGQLLFLILQAVAFVVVARALLSFFVQDWSSGPQRLVWEVTEPMLAPIRRLVPPVGGIDLSPMILIVAIYFVDQLLAPAIGD